ncbi:MAG: hypothetical protein IJY61_00915 [Candidatus Gastranaerophilales bacterium]|nr:hypothetical protein [Candidatus Gastranaerophilales bacterium]
MNIQKNNLNVQSPSFSGHRKTLDKFGYEQHNFYYLYDSSKYDCEVELYNISKDKNGNFSIADKKQGAVLTFPMVDGGIVEDLTEYDELNSEHGFAYRFKLTEKNPKDPKNPEESYGFDNGTVIGIFDGDPKNKFNVVLSNRAMINKNGAMQLIMPDEYFPGVSRMKDAEGRYQVDSAKREEASKAVRTHANKLGGEFIGITSRLPELQKEGVKRIVGTPFTRDTISSHLYWTENAYQVSPSLGTEEDFKELQVELFKNGINWIADAALVNEGFGGIHLSEVLRKGADSPSKNMFRSSERIALGVLPDKAHEKGFTRMKIINSPVNLNSDGTGYETNPKYDIKKPTYIQFYDERLASEEQKASQSPERLATYDNKNTDNVYDITKHDDAVYPFPFEVSPQELIRNINQELKTNGHISLSRNNTVSDVEAMKRLTMFSNFNVVTKEQAGGLEVWDGNVDIAKLNFYRARNDYSRFADIRPADRQAAVEAFDRGALAVRDYAVNSGKYWTQLTADTQLQYLSEYLAKNNSGDYMATIKEGVEKGALPESTLEVVDDKIVGNVTSGKYNLLRLTQADTRSELNPDSYGNDYTVSDYVMKKAMDLPLETLPVATNLLGILTSPYLAKKANVAEELGVSRFDLSKAENPNLPDEYRVTYAKMDEVYSEVARRVSAVVADIIKDDSGNFDENAEISDYGKYVISEIAPDLTKYILIKALSPDAEIKIDENGTFDFSSVDRDSITMQSFGVPFDTMTAKEEAETIVDALLDGIENITPDKLSGVKEAVENRFANRSLNDFRVAEMILDRTESGLGWRIDAAKDIASIDGIRSGVDSFDETWDNVIDFWKLYNQSIIQINPHAYTTAEITDVPDLFTWEEKGLTKEERETLQANRKYKSAGDAERKFLEETGITSLANYNYFFSLMPDLFSKNAFENGAGSWMSAQEMNHPLREKLTKGWQPEIINNPGFLFNSPADGVENSYTFFGNHDKPRPIHCLALDMGLFNSDFSADKKSSYTNKTHREVAADVLQKDIKDINFDSVNPMAIAMGQRLDGVFEETVDAELNKELKKSVAMLASGNHKGSDFDATAFGTRPFDVAIDTVLDETEYRTGEKISNREEIKAKALEKIMVPAYGRYKSMYKLLLALPGSPTDFAGDRVGNTGYETKAKNYHQQNRNTIHWEWLEDSKYSFMKTIYDDINAIANLRNRTELSALNDGATIATSILVPTKDGQGKVSTTHTKAQAMIRYNKDSLVISLHDLTGASTSLDKEMNRAEGLEISDDKKRVYLSFEDNLGEAEGDLKIRRGLKFGLKEGTRLKNALDLDDPNAPYYEVAKDSKGYYLQKKESVPSAGGYIQQTQSIVIEPRDLNTLLLCKVK